MRLVIELLNAPFAAGFLLGQKRDGIPISESSRLLWGSPHPPPLSVRQQHSPINYLVVRSGQGTEAGRLRALGGLSPAACDALLVGPSGGPPDLTAP